MRRLGLVAAAMWFVHAAAGAQMAGEGDLARVPAEAVLDRYLAKGDAAALTRAAEEGDPAAGYLLFTLHQREDAGSPAAQRWLAKLASTNTPAARYAFALASYRSDARARDKGIEVVNAAAPVSAAERQRQIAALEAIAPEFPKAYTLLSRIWRDGEWAAADPAKADAYLQKGAAAGAASALLAGAQRAAGTSGKAAEAARMADAAAAAGEPQGQVLACAAYMELGTAVEALPRCRRAADQGSQWAQLVTGELFASNPAGSSGSTGDALRYLRLAAGGGDRTIGDRAVVRLAALSGATASPAQAIADLRPVAERSGIAAWMIGRIYLDQQADPAAAKPWLSKALSLGGGDEAAILYDLARAERAGRGDWLPSLRRAADRGHRQAALALALELQGSAPTEARRYAALGAQDPALAARAQQLIAFLDERR